MWETEDPRSGGRATRDGRTARGRTAGAGEGGSPAGGHDGRGYPGDREISCRSGIADLQWLRRHERTIAMLGPKRGVTHTATPERNGDPS